ncbi:MAG TPA: T9SS type A sorting domain-containing protein, partial [Daejeonella sp.]|nr:T9SS type A sorting domain-containing protein [Daejeonella sp.]
KLGSCTQEAPSAQLNFDDSREEAAEAVLRAFPNPFSSQLYVTFTLPTAERRVVLEIYDLSGNRLKKLFAGNTEANKAYTFPVDASDFQGTVFNVRLVTKGNAYNFKLVKE